MAGLAVAAVAVVAGLAVWFLLNRPAPPPAAPPPPPPKWECGEAYGEEICERSLPPVLPTPPVQPAPTK